MGGQLRLKLEHAVDFGRDRFVVSEQNRETVKTLDNWPNGRGGALALIGPAGVGKSHLAAAWAERVGARTVTLADLTSELSDDARPLLLEDADAAAHGEAFFHLLNKAQAPGGRLLLTGRELPRNWAVQVADLRSRLNAIPVILLKEPDDAVLRGMLLKLFQQRNIRPPADLLAYLAARMERSAGAAQAVVTALDEAASAQNRAVSRSLAREILQDDAEDGNDEP